MASEHDFEALSADILDIVDPKKEERTRVGALQSFLDDGGGSATTELEQLDHDHIINEEITELDKHCSHLEQIVRVSGDVQISYYDEFHEQDEDEMRRLSGELLLSKGFTVQSVRGADGASRLTVGHLFEVPGAGRTSSVNGLIEQIAVYHAFAPYGSIDIEADRTEEECRRYLEAMIPDVMLEIDALLFDAPTSAAALMRLRKLSVDRSNIPPDVLSELIVYVSSLIDLKSIPLSMFELSGTRNISISDTMSVTAVYDTNHYTGGSVAVAGKAEYLFLSPQTSYVEGEMYQSTDMRWGAGIKAEAVSESHAHLAGQTLDVMTASIRDMAPITPLLPREMY